MINYLCHEALSEFKFRDIIIKNIFVLQGGRNSRVLLVQSDSQEYVVKYYPDHRNDRIFRFFREVKIF